MTGRTRNGLRRWLLRKRNRFRFTKIPHRHWKRAHHIAHVIWMGSLSVLSMASHDLAELREYAVVGLVFGEAIALALGNEALRNAIVEYES